MNRRRRAQGFAAPRSTRSTPPPLDGSGMLQQATRLLQAKRWAHAEDLCRQLLAAQPQNPDALNMMGLIFRDVGDREKARTWLEQAIQADPNFVEARSNLGTVLREMSRLPEAQAQFEAALQIDPDHGLSLYNLGVLHQQQGDLQAAMDCYQRVIERIPELADAHNNLGTVLRAMGRYRQAVQCYRHALSLQEDPKTLTNLANALRKLGDLQGAREAYELALTWDPGYSLAYTNLGNTLRDLGHYQEALDRYRQALQITPRYREALVHLGDTLIQVQEWDLAEEYLQRALSYYPDWPRALISLAELQLTRGTPEAALATCQTCLAQDPDNRLALALRSVAYGEIGDVAARQDLLRFETLIQIRQPQPPPGYADLDAFHQELIPVIRSHPTLIWERPPQSTRSGAQTGNLLDDPTPPLPALRQLILEQAQQAIQSLTPDPDHPFLGAIPSELRLIDLWGVVIQTGGHQVPHLHPSAWISGVYYLEIPQTISPEDPEHQGWIEWGQAPERFRCQPAPEVIKICPEVGRMILFPAYLYHRTLPLAGDQDRISIAFDLVRQDGLG